MAWYNEASFYHIYPLGLTGAPARSDGERPTARLRSLWPWVDHMQDLGFTALYIGPLFASEGHGYETTDYRVLDPRLGSNADLQAFVAYCHSRQIRVILDGVFNHTGRSFFAFQDLLARREASPYRNWYKVSFQGNNAHNDGLWYETWGGYEELAKLNLQNPAVIDYHLDTVRRWVEEFDVDGLRLDAADVLDFGFMARLRQLADTLKPDFWLMGEVIHGDYGRWVGDGMLHSVTNYRLGKALYSAHNDHNYFEIAHTLDQLGPLKDRLYNFADNHDVERIYTRLQNKADFLPVQVLLFTLPGIPSVYYGSEFAISGKKLPGSDASLRPALRLEDFQEDPHAPLIRALARARRDEPALRLGSYERLHLTTTQYAYARRWQDREVLVLANNADEPAQLSFPARYGAMRALLRGEVIRSENGRLVVSLGAHDAEVLLPPDAPAQQPLDRAILQAATPAAAQAAPAPLPPAPDKPIAQMSVEELQALILEKLAKNGPVTDRMRREVAENRHLGSLQNWARSFR